MSFSFEVANALIVVPNLQNAVLSSRDEMLAFSRDVQRIEFVLRPFDGPDYLSVVFLPVGDLSIGASCKNLVLFVVQNGLLECSRLEKAEHSRSALQVPNNAGTVTTCANGLIVVTSYLDGPNPTSVFLHGGLHNLSLLCDFPYSDFSFCSS